MEPNTKINLPKNKALLTALNESGKLPPQATEIEEIVLGSLMLENSAIDIVQIRLSPETFYKTAHQIIYKAIILLHHRNEAVDIMTVTSELKKLNELDNVGGAFYITQLTSRIASSANIEHHVSILVEQYMKRSVIQCCNNSISESYYEGSDAFDVVEKLDNDLTKILEQAGKGSSMEKINLPLTKAIEELKNRELMAKNGKATGIDTGLTELNKLTGGWQNSDLIIYAGRPGMGKSSMMLHHALSAAITGVHVCIFTLEMSSVSLTNRLIQTVCDINSEHFKSGQITQSDWAEALKAMDIIAKLPIYIDQQSSTSMHYIKSQSRLLKKKGECGMIIIDYLQLIDMKTEKTIRNREQEVAEASRQAKIIAKELNVPVMLLCQLSRKVEDRKDGKPMLSDLRESGAIEQDADLVIFVYRPEYYGFEAITGIESAKGYGELLIEKHRNGPTGPSRFRYNESLTKISDFDTNTPNF